MGNRVRIRAIPPAGKSGWNEYESGEDRRFGANDSGGCRSDSVPVSNRPAAEEEKGESENQKVIPPDFSAGNRENRMG